MKKMTLRVPLSTVLGVGPPLYHLSSPPPRHTPLIKSPICLPSGFGSNPSGR